MQNILCLLNFLTKLVAKEEAQVKMESKVLGLRAGFY